MAPQPASARNDLGRLMRRLRRLLALWTLISVGGLLAVAPGDRFDLEREFGLPWLYWVRGPVTAPAHVVVVAIDEESALTLGLRERPREWPRGLHAELIQRLTAAGARLIIFDLTFDTPGALPDEDKKLASAIAAAGNVLLTESMDNTTQAEVDSGGKPFASLRKERPVPPIPVIEQAVLAYAPFMLPKTARVDGYWTFRDGDLDAPSLPVLATRHWLSTMPSAGAPAARLEIERARALAAMHWLESSGNSAFLNYYGPPRTIRTLPYSQVLRNVASPIAKPRTNVPLGADEIRGSAVFIGVSAATPGGQNRMHDDHRTVFSQADGLSLSGVEIAATAFANLLEDRPLRPLDGAAHLAIFLGWAAALALLCQWLRPSIAMVATGALALAWLWLVAERFGNEAAWWPSIIPVGVQMPLALFAGVWQRYRETRREREAVQRAFGYFLPSAVVDQLSHNDGNVTRDNRVVFGCCLSTDVSKYATLAEGMAPARLGQLLNDYFAELFMPVERSGGVVVDVVGDAMVAIWTAPATNAALRRRACLAALESVTAVDRFNHEATADRPALPTRFALHCGEILIGNVGASQHYEYRAVGDMINTASRLQGLNKVLGTRLLVSAQVICDLDGLASRPLGSFRLAGKTQALDVFELMGLQTDADEARQQLCDQFTLALRHFTAMRWHEAAQTLEQIQVQWPADGPSSFYRTQCTALLAGPTDGTWTPTIAVDTK